MNNRESIREYIREHLINLDDEIEFTDEDNIFKAGYVNSLFAMELLTYLENKFCIEIGFEDIEMENFSSVNRIIGFVERKLA